jgi:hypothetical protein
LKTAAEVAGAGDAVASNPAPAGNLQRHHTLISQ